MVSRKTLQLLDFLWFYGFIVAVILVYFYYSHDIALYLTLGMIAVITLTFFPSLFRWLRWIYYQKTVSFLKPYDLIREEEIVKGLEADSLTIHRDLFQLSKMWNAGPLVVFVKRYYLYVSKKIVEEIIHGLQMVQDSSESTSRDVIKEIGQKYPFETRAEIEAVIGKIRENHLLNAKKKSV